MRFHRRTWSVPLAVMAAALMSIGAREASAQGTVRGTVIDSASHLPIPGVQVSVPGSSARATTNEVGTFVLRSVPSGSATIRAQRLGYTPASRTVAIAGRDTASANFTLTAVIAKLTEVVTIGYGTASRANVTSAISSVTAGDIANTPVAGVDAALQGKLPGVQVTQNAGNPGNGISIRVRGPASVNAGNQPLYVVDGIPVLQDNFTQLGLGGQDITAISSLNPDEIASIDVLKDAAAAAIYGSRGSNGVVLITTKRGQAGATRLSFNGYVGRQDTPSRLGLLNSKQYVALMNESADNDQESHDFVAGVDDSVSYNWQNAIFRTAPVTDMQLAMSGGSTRSQFYLSGSSFDQKGIVIGARYQRQAGRANLDFNATDRLTLRASIGVTHENNARIEGDGSNYGIVTNAVGEQPFVPISGSFFGFGGGDEGLRYANPVALANFNSTTLKTLRTLGNVEARYAFTDWLSATGRTGVDLIGVDELQWQSPKVDLSYASSIGGVGQSGHTSATKYVNEGFLTLDAVHSDNQQLSFVAGASTEQNHSDLNFLRGEGFPSGFTEYIRNAAAITSYDGSATGYNLVSFFTRANWSLDQRYLLSASLRRDGSSRFGSEQRWGVFPALSGGWLLTNEGFAHGLSRWGSIKLRASYGATGNQPSGTTGDFASLSLVSGVPYGSSAGIAPNQLGNPNLRWETTRESDFGTDIMLFNSRVGITADYYHRKTTDLLVQQPIAGISGYTSIWSNVGAIQNNGVDLGLNTTNIRTDGHGSLGWTSDLNLTFNRNKVLSLYGGQPIITGINGRQASIVAVGQPIGEFYMYKFNGVDPQTGDAIFQDTNGDGSITSADRTFVGNPQPKYFGGFTNTFSVGAFDLRGVLTFSRGGKIFNMARIFTDDGGCTYDNKSTLELARWQKPGDITNEPRMSYDCTSGADVISSRFVEDGSYTRLDEITLGYRLPHTFTTLFRNDARLYISGRNLKTWTKYSGYNPDVNSAGSDASIIQGTDYYAYPIPRTFSVGVSATW